jgi:AcrR family transcriptional regulator
MSSVMKHLQAVRRGRARKPAAEKNDSSTRQRLLEAAGHVFADRGFDRATGKEICKRAGVNTAAINYHFGGIENLYLAVLEEIRNRMAATDSVVAAIGAETGARNKLRAIFAIIVGATLRSDSFAWMGQIIGRELITPSRASEALWKNARVRIALFKHEIAKDLGLPEDHPAVERGCISVLAPMHWLLIVDRRLIKRIFPNLGLGLNDANALIDHMTDFALAGLVAVAEKERNKPKSPFTKERLAVGNRLHGD